MRDRLAEPQTMPRDLSRNCEGYAAILALGPRSTPSVWTLTRCRPETKWGSCLTQNLWTILYSQV